MVASDFELRGPQRHRSHGALPQEYHLDKHHCLQLGHHATGDGTLHTYGRDFLAPALRKYHEMLRAVRNGVFFPDLSRSGRFQDPPPVSNEVPVKVEDSGCESSGPGSFDVVSQTVEEQAEALDDLERPEPLVTGREVQSSSTSLSSSTSSEEEAELRGRVLCNAGGLGGQISRPRSWRPDCAMFQHVRTQVVHLKAIGSISNSFVCGRKISADYTEIDTCAFLDSANAGLVKVLNPFVTLELCLQLLTLGRPMCSRSRYPRARQSLSERNRQSACGMPYLR